MNEFQRLWWEQARSDYGVFRLLSANGSRPCHPLHYLQMATEKLGKAYFWRGGTAPASSHVSFVRFLQALNSRPTRERDLIALCLQFRRPDDMQRWVESAVSLAHQIERLAPALAGDGPNPEYPWPRNAPTHTPVLYDFPIWNQLTDDGRGRQLLKVIDAAVTRFPDYC